MTGPKILTELGRYQGDIWFRPVTVYVHGNQMIVPDPITGKYGYREGDWISGVRATDKMLETDANGKPKRLTQPNTLPKTNIPIQNVWNIKIAGTDKPTETEQAKLRKPIPNQHFQKRYVDPTTSK